jgi:hypothetical protein
MKDTFRLKICLPRNQMENAFTSAANMQRFIGAIENRICTKREVAREALAYRTENNLIASKMQYGMNVVNLLSEYRAASGDATITAATALENADFLRYCVRRFKTDKKLLARFSGNYNVEGYGTFTPADRLKIFALTDFATAVETVLRSNTYHDAFVTLGGYREDPYWQGRGLGASFADRSTIRAYPALREATSVLQDQSGIVFVMQDYDAAMIANEDIPVDSIYNPEGRFYKYWYGCDCSYYNDLAENVIVYVIADDDNYNVGLGLICEQGSSSGTTKVHFKNVVSSIDTTNPMTFKYKVNITSEKLPKVSDADPADYTSLTPGITNISVMAAGMQLIVVAIQNGKIILTGDHIVTADEIKE